MWSRDPPRRGLLLSAAVRHGSQVMPLSGQICFPREGCGPLAFGFLTFLRWSFPCRELSHNKIEDLPSFHQCQRLEEL